MGKRKYDGDKDGKSKKSKVSDNVEVEDTGDEQPQKQSNKIPLKRNEYDIKHFRKELAGKQGQTMVLTQFLQVCLNPDYEVDYLMEYLKTGGNSHEILRQINQDNKKNLTLATPTFHLFHLIILKVQSSLPHMITITEEACRYFLNTFMPTVEIMISENSGPRHRKIILKLLTSMVTLNPDLGVEVLHQAPLTPKHLQHVVEKSNYKEKDNVRTAFVHFMTSFLVDGHLPLIKALLEKQGLLALVIPGLVHDEAEAVLMFLNILKKNVVENPYITKSLKLKTFSHQVLHNMFKIFSWKGPPELSNDNRNEGRPEIMALLSEIILTLFTSHKLGLYFVDSSLGTTDANKNQNLYKALLMLKRPWENEDERKVILEIVHKCPDLHRAVINIVEQNFEPQHSPVWERTTGFVMELLNTLKPEEMVPKMGNLNPGQVANFVRFISLPVPILKVIQANLNKDQTIALYCAKILVKTLQTLKRYIQILETKEAHVAEIRNKLEYFLPKHLPTPAVIVSLIQDIISGKNNSGKPQNYVLLKPDATDSLIHLTDLLLLYSDVHPAFFETLEGTLDMKKLLDFSTTLSSEHTSLLKFKIVSLWLTLDSSAISLKNPMFKDLFLIMLEVYTRDDGNTWLEAKDTLHNFFKNTAVFETDEDEIHLILYCLRNSKVNPIGLIGDIVEYVLAHKKSLNEHVRSQVNYDIPEEGSKAQLDKLFDDLMENRSTVDSVFLESKVPSPFIVGCIQYLQNNKELKKNIKHFLSLYVANLLHNNYSPEITEVLIGDCKLDVRSYVASWIGQPIPLLESISGNDDVLKNISKSIIGNENIALTEVFPHLEEVEEEQLDIIIAGVAYKIDLSRNIDSSELLIWAKYLIFCTVRLTNMEKLKEEQQKKIIDYLQCIIAIGKKYHLIDVCRLIILNVFKNPYILKIYKPLDLNKDESNLLATKFIIEVMVQQNDVVEYLNKKQNILKSFQKKNYDDIIETLVKIKKRKTLNSEHTMKVLEVVGLCEEDNLLLLNQIFETDISACFNEDKEPSLVLELLKVLIERYSKHITLELPQLVLKKCMKLYTDLLTNKELNPNLTNLESALIQYFESKPHQVKYIAEENFKKFFEASSIRKTTSHLASILLRYNLKLCNILKQEVAKPEILSQRELTLPLGNAVLDHPQFLLGNKEFLSNIYNEYKANIWKFLEKPHKAGQIYVTCWKFVRKLILECMELQDCEKLYSKSHKFEIVELSHINLLQAVFLKVCLHNDAHKKEYLINYFMSMLHITTIALKEGKDNDILSELVAKIYHVVEVSKHLGFNVQEKEDFQKVLDSAVWQNFCKATLKDSLKVKTVDQGRTLGPQLLHLLSTLVKLFYPSDHQDIVTLFDMVTSHSEFLNVMLSYHSTEVKSRLIEFLYALISINGSVMKAQQIPVYLSAYHATRSPCDRLLLSILYYYESQGLPVNEYKPYVFGDSAANYYAVRKNRASSLWAHPTPNQVLNLFEKEIIERTVKRFPVTQKLNYQYELPSNIGDDSQSLKKIIENMYKDGIFKPNICKDVETAVSNLTVKGKYDKVVSELNGVDLASLSHLDEDDGIYDPVFLFPLLSHLLAPGSVASCFKMLRSGLLSVPIMALSSHCSSMRAAAYHVLHRFCMLLETETRHKNDKLFLTDFINTLRQSLSTAIDESGGDPLKNPRLPAINALYLARALMVSTAPFDPLYKPVNNYLIAKETIDFSIVPDFLTLFHDSDVEASERRLWILEVIKDGTKNMTDVNVVFKTMCLKMILDFYSCVLSDRKVQERTLSVLSSLVAVPRAFEILLEGYGLLSWLHYAIKQLSKGDRSLVMKIMELIKNMILSMNVNAFSKYVFTRNNPRNGKTTDFIELKISKDDESEIAGLLYDLLPHLENLDIENKLFYLEIYGLLSRKTVKAFNKRQMLSLVQNVCKDNQCVKLLEKALLSNNVTILKSKNMDVCDLQKDSLLKELATIVHTYLV